MAAQGSANLVGYDERRPSTTAWEKSKRRQPMRSWIQLHRGRYGAVDLRGKKVLLPAGTVDRADTNSGKLYVDLTKDQIKDSPEFDQSSYNQPAYRNRVGDYYGRYYTR